MTTDQTINKARQAWLADKHDEALDQFRSACGAKPNDLRLAIEFANYLGMRFEIEEAQIILTRCERAAGENPRIWHQLGVAYQRAYRPDDAIRCFRQATRDKLHVHPALKMVEWYERRGRISEALAIVGELPAGEPLVQFWGARLSHRTGDLEAAGDTLRSLASDTVDTETRISAFYSLAEVLDEQDRPEAAMTAAREAKQLQLPRVKPQLQIAESLQALEQNFVSTVQHEHFQAWGEATAHEPTAFLTGPPRSGTSVMCRMLGMHEELAVADEIEAYPTYLQPRMLAGRKGTSAGEVLDSLDEGHLHGCRTLYRKWLSSALDRDLAERPLLDKFPSTTHLIGPYRRLLPNSVVVVALRDPRDVVISCFLRHLEINPVSAQFCRIDRTVARVVAEVNAWMVLREKLTPPWCEIRYEDIVSGNYDGLAEVLNSLGLAWNDRFAEVRSSPGEQPVRSPTYAQLRQPITNKRIGRWQLYRKFLEPHSENLTQLARALGYD